MKCVVILSSKCAGSTLLQGMLCAGPHAQHVRRTRQHEFETLYWVKAAAMLRLPQEPMVRSELPMDADRGEAELRRLIEENSGGVYASLTGWDLAVAGWRALCEAHAPVFVEKSPHHLRQPSALELLADCVEWLPEVETRLVALVRNPLAVICSAYRRWGYPPAAMEEEWRATYGNLASLPPTLASRLTVVRYEEVLSAPSVLEELFRFCGDEEGWARSELQRDRAEAWRGDGASATGSRRRR